MQAYFASALEKSRGPSKALIPQALPLRDGARTPQVKRRPTTVSRRSMSTKTIDAERGRVATLAHVRPSLWQPRC